MMSAQLVQQNKLSIEGPFIIGIDGGGTKCKAVLMDRNNQILGVGISGSGNPVYGVKQAQASIVECASEALNTAKSRDHKLIDLALEDIIAGIGLAGVNIPLMYEEMTKWKSPFKSTFITTDLLIACLGAHSGKDGAVIVTGTGSCGYSYANGKSKVVGAHGFPQGDKGSGAWFGLKAVEATLLSLDKIGPETAISPYVFTILDVDDSQGIVEKVASKTSSLFASLASAVFSALKEGDATAIAIVKEGSDYINHMAKLLNHPTSARISLLGGLSETITPYLDKNLQEKLTPALSPPEVGAVIYARQQLASQLRHEAATVSIKGDL